jgi:hypothetical protein
MDVMTINTKDVEQFRVVPGPATWEKPRVHSLDSALNSGYDTLHIMDSNGPSLVAYRSKSGSGFEYPAEVGEVVVMSGSSVRKPVSESWEVPYGETIRQNERPEDLVYHGTNIEALLPVIENDAIMQGGMKNWFASHFLEKAYHENPELHLQIQRPRDPAEKYAKLGQYNKRIKQFVPVVLRFKLDELPELEVISRLDGNPEHYRTNQDVSLSSLTMASKCDVITGYQSYMKKLGEKNSREDYQRLANALGFDETNFFIRSGQ